MDRSKSGVAAFHCVNLGDEYVPGVVLRELLKRKLCHARQVR